MKGLEIVEISCTHCSMDEVRWLQMLEYEMFWICMWTKIWHTNLESKNDGPNETQCETWTAIHNIMCTHVLKVHFLFM